MRAVTTVYRSIFRRRVYDGLSRRGCIPLTECGRGFERMRGRWNGVMAAFACVLPLTIAACGNNGPPDFALSLASGQPAAATITQGATAPVTIQVSAVKGSTGSITLVLSGLPPGVGVAPGSATVGIGSPQMLCPECCVRCSRDERAGHADGDRGVRKSALLQLDHAYADRDADGGGTDDILIAQRICCESLQSLRAPNQFRAPPLTAPGWTYPYPAAGRTCRP